MKNHWLNKKKEKEANFGVELDLKLESLPCEIAIQLEGDGVFKTPVWPEALSIFQDYIPPFGGVSTIPPSYHVSGIADPALTTVQTVSIDFDTSQLPGADWGVSMSCTCMDFEPGQTALAELDNINIEELAKAPDLEIGDGSIKYTREIKIGQFTFKDAGELGVDIFQDGARLGWLNCQGEESLIEWLKNKSKQKNYKNKYDDYKDLSNHFGVVANESFLFGVKPHEFDGDWDLGESFYKFKHDNIIPGSLIVTLNEKKIIVPSYGNEICEYLASIGVKTIAVNYKEGNISIEWTTPPGKVFVNLCYEYEVKV